MVFWWTKQDSSYQCDFIKSKFNFIHLKNIDKIVYITQDPIGRTPRSNPATYTGVFDDIRDLFASTPDQVKCSEEYS